MIMWLERAGIVSTDKGHRGGVLTLVGLSNPHYITLRAAQTLLTRLPREAIHPGWSGSSHSDGCSSVLALLECVPSGPWP